MNSIPETPAGEPAAAFSKPAGVEPNPAPALAPNDPVRRAILVLRAFGDLNQGQVRVILPMWRHFRTLSAPEMLAIVDAFPEGDYTASGIVLRGGGMISGPMLDGGE